MTDMIASRVGISIQVMLDLRSSLQCEKSRIVRRIESAVLSDIVLDE